MKAYSMADWGDDVSAIAGSRFQLSDSARNGWTQLSLLPSARRELNIWMDGRIV